MNLMVNWFGPKSWGAPICETTPRCAIPVGALCVRCARPIGEADQGITLPFIGSNSFAFPPEPADRRVAYHLTCHLKSVLPHTMWRATHLTPDATDGVVDGVFACPTCGVRWTAAEGWQL